MAEEDRRVSLKQRVKGSTYARLQSWLDLVEEEMGPFFRERMTEAAMVDAVVDFVGKRFDGGEVTIRDLLGLRADD